jgi:chromosome partitioning protein
LNTIAVFSTKGGAGKSAVTALLAETLACKPYDLSVLVVDLDAQQSTATALLGDERLHAALREKKSVTALLRARRERPLSKEVTNRFLAERPAVSGKGKFNFLQSIWVLAPDREDWHDLDEELRREKRDGRNGGAQDALLRDALAPLADDFDIVLIDFPGHDTGPIVRCGLSAADRWLFPVTPDRAGTRDLDGSRRVIRSVFEGSGRQFKGLGTLLTMCQMRSSNEYKSARNALVIQAKARRVPQLFPQDAELLFWTEVKNALDDTRKYNTLDQKLAGTTSPLYKAMQKLTKETLTRLKIPVASEADIEAAAPVNDLVTQNW